MYFIFNTLRKIEEFWIPWAWIRIGCVCSCFVRFIVFDHLNNKSFSKICSYKFLGTTTDNLYSSKIVAQTQMHTCQVMYRENISIEHAFSHGPSWTQLFFLFVNEAFFMDESVNGNILRYKLDQNYLITQIYFLTDFFDFRWYFVPLSLSIMTKIAAAHFVYCMTIIAATVCKLKRPPPYKMPPLSRSLPFNCNYI